DRSEARKQTGIEGRPVFLWVGRLDKNKDPLTVLDGFTEIVADHPNASLYMIWSDDQLSGEVSRKTTENKVLTRSVKLLGPVAHENIEAYYHSADYFVLGSHYEGSGYALSEALRCGCVPIVTDIPSFRMMTNMGQFGALWKPGDKDSFVEAVVKATNNPLLTEANAC